MNLKHVYNNHVGGDISFDQFKQMCNFCWKEDYGFITIDKQSPFNKGRFRFMFDKFLQI